jgi:hypothetical protein
VILRKLLKAAFFASMVAAFVLVQFANWLDDGGKE